MVRFNLFLFTFSPLRKIDRFLDTTHLVFTIHCMYWCVPHDAWRGRQAELEQVHDHRQSCGRGRQQPGNSLVRYLSTQSSPIP